MPARILFYFSVTYLAYTAMERNRHRLPSRTAFPEKCRISLKIKDC
jgi:hypothetical protein